MTIINTSSNKLMQIGYEGEDKVTILRFSYSEKWLENGEGIFTVRVLRNGENQAYNAQSIKDDRENCTIDMTVTDVELSKKGYGEMQLVYTGADFVKKSQVYKYYVSRSVDDAIDPPESDVYTQIIESLADLRVDFNELADMVSEINDDIGELTELTTANKLNIVESINEVNARSFVSVDDELSDTSTNPVQNLVITNALSGKANTKDVADAVTDIEADIGALRTAVQSKVDTATVSAIADAVTGLQTSKADKTYVDTRLATKADAQTVTDLTDDVSDLQTEIAEKVWDVQINETSIVTDGVANVPVASNSEFGVVKTNSNNGIFSSSGTLAINNASESDIKTGTNASKPLTSHREHIATFYGLAKVAGHDEKNSTLPLGTYSEEAKTAIRTMLGLQDVYEDYSSALDALGGGS